MGVVGERPSTARQKYSRGLSGVSSSEEACEGVVRANVVGDGHVGKSRCTRLVDGAWMDSFELPDTNRKKRESCAAKAEEKDETLHGGDVVVEERR